MSTKASLIKQTGLALAGALMLVPLTFARQNAGTAGNTNRANNDNTTAQTQDDPPAFRSNNQNDYPANRAIDQRLNNANMVLHEVIDLHDNIPRDLMDRTRCVIVIPSTLKGAFLFGASYGKGAMVCRTGADHRGPWGAPAMYALEGVSFGFQWGGEATDYVFLVMNDHGAESLLHSKVKLGGNVSAAAGPVGRTLSASTDAFMRAEILSYSRARGAFAGVALTGAVLHPDTAANQDLYGLHVKAEQIVYGNGQSIKPPRAGEPLVATLQKASPQMKS